MTWRLALLWLAAGSWAAAPTGAADVLGGGAPAGTLAEPERTPRPAKTGKKKKRRFQPVAMRGSLLSEDASGAGPKTLESEQLEPEPKNGRRNGVELAAAEPAPARLEIPSGDVRLEPGKARELSEGKGVHAGEKDQLPGSGTKVEGLAAVKR